MSAPEQTTPLEASQLGAPAAERMNQTLEKPHHVHALADAGVIQRDHAQRIVEGEKPRGSLVNEPFGEDVGQHRKGGGSGFIDTTKTPLTGPKVGEIMSQAHFGPMAPAVPSEGSTFARDTHEQHVAESAPHQMAGPKPLIGGGTHDYVAHGSSGGADKSKQQQSTKSKGLDVAQQMSSYV